MNGKTLIKNPGKTCADCIHHSCNLGCVKKPKQFCKGHCIKTLSSRTCYASGKSCKYFKQIDWSNI